MQKELKRFRFRFPLPLKLSLVCLALGCAGSETFVPKPRAYPRIEFPTRAYESFDAAYCDFVFEKPTYVTVQKDEKFFDEETEHACWFDLYYPTFNCKIHCTYYPISTKAPFDKLHNDAFKFAMEHNKKATYIDELKIQKPNDVSGFIFNLEGPVATPFQFYLTDSTHHFLRGSLYFNTQIRPDSLAPLYEFVKQDITHMINTFAWN